MEGVSEDEVNNLRTLDSGEETEPASDRSYDNPGQDTQNIGQDTQNIGQDTQNIGQDTQNIGQDTRNVGEDNQDMVPGVESVAEMKVPSTASVVRQGEGC